jgi:hypothetical protein
MLLLFYSLLLIFASLTAAPVDFTQKEPRDVRAHVLRHILLPHLRPLPAAACDRPSCKGGPAGGQPGKCRDVPLALLLGPLRQRLLQPAGSIFERLVFPFHTCASRPRPYITSYTPKTYFSRCVFPPPHTHWRALCPSLSSRGASISIIV